MSHRHAIGIGLRLVGMEDESHFHPTFPHFSTLPHSLQDLRSPLDVGERYRHLAVKPPGALEGRVEGLGEVSGSDDNDPVVGVKPVLRIEGCGVRGVGGVERMEGERSSSARPPHTSSHRLAPILIMPPEVGPSKNDPPGKAPCGPTTPPLGKPPARPPSRSVAG